MVHFDGWRGYDYWTHALTDDIHPVGWFEQVGRKHGAFNAPKFLGLLISAVIYYSTSNISYASTMCFVFVQNQRSGTCKVKHHAVRALRSNNIMSLK